MGSGGGLDIVLGVPVRIEDYYDVGAGEVYADAACFGGQEEDFALFVGVVVTVDGVLSLFCFDLSIDLLVFDALTPQQLLQQQQHMCKLTKYQHLLSLLAILIKQLIH